MVEAKREYHFELLIVIPLEAIESRDPGLLLTLATHGRRGCILRREGES